MSNAPVRCVKFISRKNWFVAGSDDFQLRVFNYNTHDNVASVEAHPDYIWLVSGGASEGGHRVDGDR